MRIYQLSKNQVFTPSRQSMKNREYFQFHQLFTHLSYKVFHPSLKVSRALKSRHILPESYLLPFQVNTKFFLAPSLQTSPNGSRKKV
jgi:hypothetical protein